MFSKLWTILLCSRSVLTNVAVSDQEFCKVQSNVCVRFCRTTKQDNDWKPLILKEAEKNGSGKALALNPNCNLTNNLFVIDSRKHEFHLDIISNGNLSWGNELWFTKFSCFWQNMYLPGGKIWPNEFYCISRMSDQKSKPPDWQKYYLCSDKSITKGDYEGWIDKVDLKLIPGLLVISMIFLVLAFLHTVLEQREKLFG